MSDAGYKRWAHTEWWHEGYERLWGGEDGTKEESGTEVEVLKEDKGETGTDEILGPKSTREDIKASIVYLTADSADELTELKETETYIIGGICDHNRYKVSKRHLPSSPTYNMSARTYAKTNPSLLKYAPPVSPSADTSPRSQHVKSSP